jgi:hypothetical protein
VANILTQPSDPEPSSELLEMIKYYTDHLLNEEDPERTAGYHLAQCINEYLYLEIEETQE